MLRHWKSIIVTTAICFLSSCSSGVTEFSSPQTLVRDELVADEVFYDEKLEILMVFATGVKNTSVDLTIVPANDCWSMSYQAGNIVHPIRVPFQRRRMVVSVAGVHDETIPLGKGEFKQLADVLRKKPSQKRILYWLAEHYEGQHGDVLERLVAEYRKAEEGGGKTTGTTVPATKYGSD